MELHLKIKTIVTKNDFFSMEGRSTEFIQLILEIDDNGIIKNIHPIGTDTSAFYRAFKVMKSEHFKDWKCLDCKDKIIVIPYFYLSNNLGNKNYLDKLFTDYYLKIPLKDLITISEKVIIIKWLTITADKRSVSLNEITPN